MSTPTIAIVKVRFPEGYVPADPGIVLEDLALDPKWKAEIVSAPSWVKEPAGNDPIKPDKLCESCGCPIKFVTSSETEKPIPIDLRSPCYRVGGTRDRGAFVSHYCTCSNPAKHSKKT